MSDETTVDPATEAGTDEQRSRTRFRLVAGVVLLFGLAFIQDPGLLTSDTKFDLVAAPADFLGRALHLWDGEGAFGQLQNQAYGYLWPMGPFFLLGWLAAIPGWVVQRLWLGLVMSVAFVGIARLARALGVRSDLACLVAGIAFALSPRLLTTLGPISIEAWPSAVAPWVLLPLVKGATQGSPRRAAALSALAVAMVGGVNAAATFAVLPLGVVWLLTRTPGPRRRSMMLWWPAFTLLGTLWWLVPLFVMGSYSPPFLDYIETTSVTTFPTTLFDALRGTSNWVPYVDSGSRAGNDLLTTSYLALNSGVVLLLGFAGLLDRRTPHRRFLALAVLVGVLMVTAGHEGSVQGWFAGGVRGLLDGSLSPLRNVHKFDPILRVPLVLGLAFVLDRVLAALPSRGAVTQGSGSDRSALLARINQLALVAMTVAVVVGASLPAFAGRIAPAGALLAVPDYWTQTADWLAEEQGNSTALMIPGSPFAEYVWGSPKDEPLQYLADSRWATRNVIPLTPPGNIRMLDGIEDRLAQGEGSVGLTDYLARAGVRFLVVRNDLERGDDVPDPVLVHQAIDASPGLSRVATFGPDVGGDGHLDSPQGRTLVSGGWQALYPAVEIYEVPGRTTSAVASAVPPVVAGGPEDLLDLADLGVLGEQPVQLAADLTAQQLAAGRPASPLVLTDGLRARERFFARIHDGASSVITPGDVRRSGNPSRDYLIDTGDRWSTTARLHGARSLSASSSMSDANAFGGPQRGELPYAAVDGSPDTAWVSGPGDSDRAWWQVDLDEPVEPTTVRLTGGPEAPVNQTVRVRTEDGLTDPVELGPGVTRSVPLDGASTRWVRVEDASASETGRTASLAEVQIPGVRVRRSLALPTLPADWGDPDTIVLRADRDTRQGCAVVDQDVRCVGGRERASEEPLDMRRTVTLNQAGRFTPSLVAAPRGGAALDDLVLEDQPVGITASSVAVPDPRASPVAAIDGDPATSWLAATDDLRPTLSLSWLGRQRVTGLALSVDDDTAARLPRDVTLTWPGGVRRVEIDDRGRARFRPIRTDQLRIRINEADPVADLGFDALSRPVSVGIGELRVLGVPYLPLGLSQDPVRYPCGTGPRLLTNGRSVATSVLASPADLARGLPARADACSTAPMALAAGENGVTVEHSPAFAAGSAVLTTDPPVTAAPSDLHDAGPSAVGAATRTFTPGTGDTVVATGENANPGWSATQDGQALEPLVLDGWQQGWALASDSAPVTQVFSPDRSYRWGLGLGLVCFVGLVVVTVLTRRRWAGPSPDPLQERDLPALVTITAIAVGAALVAGWPGLAVAALTCVATVLVRRRAGEAAPWVLAASCLPAAAAYAVTPWGSASGWAGNDSWPHYLVLVPLVALLASSAESLPRRPLLRLPRSLSRSAGSSTKR